MYLCASCFVDMEGDESRDEVITQVDSRCSRCGREGPCSCIEEDQIKLLLTKEGFKERIV